MFSLKSDSISYWIYKFQQVLGKVLLNTNEKHGRITNFLKLNAKNVYILDYTFREKSHFFSMYIPSLLSLQPNILLE